jgi:hypothetical protein
MTIEDYVSRTRQIRDTSRESADAGVPWDSLRIEAQGDELALLGRGGIPATLNNWSLSQICALPARDGSGTLAPTEFLGRLSTNVAADVLTDRLTRGIGRQKPAHLLVSGPTASMMLRSITTTAYERVWDYDIALRVAELCRRSSWGPCEAFRTASGPARHAWGDVEPLPLGWVGDRSSFIALADYDTAIEHGKNRYSRFMLLSNSEVGGASVKLVFGLMDFACCNFILWGCTEVYEATFRHTKTVHDRFLAAQRAMALPMPREERDELQSAIKVASTFLLGEGEQEVIAVTRAVTELPQKLVQDAYTRTLQTDRYGRPGTAWSMLQGLTEASQHVDVARANVDKRADIDAKAARLMGYVKSKV